MYCTIDTYFAHSSSESVFPVAEPSSWIKEGLAKACHPIRYGMMNCQQTEKNAQYTIALHEILKNNVLSNTEEHSNYKKGKTPK